MRIAGYLAKWATKQKLGIYSRFLKEEIHRLSPAQLTETLEVLQIITGMVGDEIDERASSTVH